MLDYDRRGIEYMLDAGYAVANAPKQTSVERALEENAKMLKEQQGMHLDFDRKHPPAPKKPAYTMPDGQQMVAFGDSVMLASSKGLQSVFPESLLMRKPHAR